MLCSDLLHLRFALISVITVSNTVLRSSRTSTEMSPWPDLLASPAASFCSSVSSCFLQTLEHWGTCCFDVSQTAECWRVRRSTSSSYNLFHLGYMRSSLPAVPYSPTLPICHVLVVRFSSMYPGFSTSDVVLVNPGDVQAWLQLCLSLIFQNSLG